nr:TlpA disulfide reductase family protein [uncultured Allomuricauda sp.]
MKKIVLFLLTSYCTILVGQEKLKLNGFVKGYKGKVKLILNIIKPTHETDMINEEVLYMIDGKFSIEKKLTAPTLLSIRIRPEISGNFHPGLFESTFIWVDNREMTLTGEKGNFENCDVSGYFLEEEHKRSKAFVQKKLTQHKAKIDSLAKISTKDAKKQYDRLKSINKIYLENKYQLDYCYLNPQSFISTYNYSWFVKWIPQMVPKSKAATFYASLRDEFKHNIYGKQIKNYIDNIAVNPKLKIGDKPYPFALPDSTGTIISLNSLKGKVILLDFWSSSCGPCRKEHRNYTELHDKFKAKGFTILSISQDRNRKNWTKAMIKDNMIWPSVWDKEMNISKYTYLVSGIPQNYLINTKGHIIAENVKGKHLGKSLEKLFLYK